MAQSETLRRYSQNLRKNMTKEERHLWYDFLKHYPVAFHRQYSFGNYIVDFYCHKAKLVVELDGSQHCSAHGLLYDRERTDYLENQGLYVLRFSNLDVMGQFRAVCETIDAAVTHRLHAIPHPPPSGAPSPPGEGLTQKEGYIMEFITNSPAETEAIGAALGKILTPGTVIAYRGDLGAGKTAFTRGLARGLGCTELVTSPTYTIVNEYLGGRIPLFHFDMYRLASSDDLWDIGWEDYLDRGGICAVEWSENVEDAMEDAIRITIHKTGEESRRIVMEGGPQLADLSL